jgi:hypothetical protein
MPAPVTTPSMGTARRCRTPREHQFEQWDQFADPGADGSQRTVPRLAITTTPSPTRAVIAARKNDPRRPLSAHHHT